MVDLSIAMLNYQRVCLTPPRVASDHQVSVRETFVHLVDSTPQVLSQHAEDYDHQKIGLLGCFES